MTFKFKTDIIKIAASALLFFSVAQAQNEIDAYRLSGLQLMGTARVLGVGGAFSAVGADFSAAYLNPAGLGVYRRSELELSTHFRSISTDANYMGNSQEDSRVNLGFSNIGYVYHGQRSSYNRATRRMEQTSSGFRDFSVGVGLNQIANFHRSSDVTGYNNRNSITDYLAGQAQNTNVNDLIDQNSYAALAYWAYMIDTVNGSVYDYVGAAQGGNVNQRYRSAESGRINEWTVAFGGNYNDRIYFGASLGLQDVNYRQDLEYIEEDINNFHQTWANDSTPFNNLILDDQYRTSGSGVNLRAGLIFRPTDFIRLGISAQTPTWLSLRDNYSTDFSGQVDNDNQVLGKGEVEGVYTYNLRTPWKVTTGLMVLLQKRGFITADFEMTDYSTSKFSADVNQASPFFYDFAQENGAISDKFDFAYNLRLGGELRLGMFRLRGGYAQYGAVLNEAYLVATDFNEGSQQNYSGKKQYLTSGFGYKTENFYLDFAFVRGMTSDNINVYNYYDDSGIAPELLRKTTSNNFILTTGFTF